MESAVCTFCGRTADSCRPVHQRGKLPGSGPYGLCCDSCDAEVREFSERLERISRPGHKDALEFDFGSDKELPHLWRRKARSAAIVTAVLDRLPPVPPSVTPAAALITALTTAVFVPEEPRGHPDHESALADIAQRLNATVRRENNGFSQRLGTVGGGAGVMLQEKIGDLLRSQYLYLVDTGHSVYGFYWYSR